MQYLTKDVDEQGTVAPATVVTTLGEGRGRACLVVILSLQSRVIITLSDLRPKRLTTGRSEPNEVVTRLLPVYNLIKSNI